MTQAGVHLEGGVDGGAAAPAEEERRDPAELVAQPARRPQPPHVLRKPVPLELRMHAQGIMRCLLGTFCSLDRSQKSRPLRVRPGRRSMEAHQMGRPDVSRSDASIIYPFHSPLREMLQREKAYLLWSRYNSCCQG